MKRAIFLGAILAVVWAGFYKYLSVLQDFSYGLGAFTVAIGATVVITAIIWINP